MKSVLKNKQLKRILFWSLQFMTFGVAAQAPTLINYQGAARLQNVTPLDNRSVSVKFDIHKTSPDRDNNKNDKQQA